MVLFNTQEKPMNATTTQAVIKAIVEAISAQHPNVGAELSLKFGAILRQTQTSNWHEDTRAVAELIEAAVGQR